VIKASQKHKVNKDISVDEVRLIGAEGEQLGIISTTAALEVAVGAGLDLVELQPNAKPPVCRLMDYGKHLFQLKKKHTESKKKQKQVQIKELKYRPGIEDGDYQVKFRNLTRFLEHGDKVKITLRFRGREMAHQELGMKTMQRIIADISEIGTVEQHPKMEGRQMLMVISPGGKS
jgi:translation initiation factor IF-3